MEVGQKIERSTNSNLIVHPFDFFPRFRLNIHSTEFVEQIGKVETRLKLADTNSNLQYLKFLRNSAPKRH